MFIIVVVVLGVLYLCRNGFIEDVRLIDHRYEQIGAKHEEKETQTQILFAEDDDFVEV
mgnify:FL=1